MQNQTNSINLYTSVLGSTDYRYGTDAALNTASPETIINLVTPNLNLPFSFPTDSNVPTN